jgi:glycine/serine hydroxymethyltransferase
MKLNASGVFYKFVHYGVRREDCLLDFDQVARLAREHKPKLIVAGASAYPREIPHGKFAEIAREAMPHFEFYCIGVSCRKAGKQDCPCCQKG